MGWTTATIELDDNQTQIRDVNVSELAVRGGHFYTKRSQLDTSIIYIATVLFLSFFDPLPMEGLLHYIAPSGLSWSYTCWSFELLLECLSHQLPPEVFGGGCKAKKVLFKDHFLISQRVSYRAFNAVITAFLRYFWVLILLVHLWGTSLSLEFPRRSTWLLGYTFELCLAYPKRYSFLDHLPIRTTLIRF